MGENKNTLFTIGQFAALHKINKKTLMWYDQVGILKPALIKDNGYRYYTYFQSNILETILLLRSLDVSIPEIKSFLEHRSPEALKVLLEESILSVDKKINHLKGIKDTLTGQRDDVLFLLELDLSKIEVVNRDQEHLAILNTTRDVTLEKELELLLSETKKLAFDHLHDATYGSMIPVDSLYKGDFDDYTALYINTYSNQNRPGIHIKPAGRYLRGFWKGKWEKLPEKYVEMLLYAKDHGLILYDYAYESGLNDMVISSEDEYITQIEIPIA